MQSIFNNYFQNISDPRSIRNQRHPLMTLIATSLLSVLSGIDSFSGMQDFTEMHMEKLSEYFEFPNGVPSHDTYQRLWDGIHPSEFEKSFELFTSSIAKLSGKVINIDGKTIRNSGRNKNLHLVSAWCRANKLVLAQEKVKEKSNEIIAIPQLLSLLDLENKIITIDAMGAQRDICKQIIEAGGDYVISLKGNQSSLYNDVKLYFADDENKFLSNENNDKGHGRIEQRNSSVSHDIRWLREMHKWPGINAIGKIEAKVIKIKNNKTTKETRYYISSLAITAQQLNDIARAHWEIENKLHWVLDVVFNEDKSCIRNDNAAYNMDILRKWALNVLNNVKRKPSQSIKGLMRKNSMSIKHLLLLLNNYFHA